MGFEFVCGTYNRRHSGSYFIKKFLTSKYTAKWLLHCVHEQALFTRGIWFFNFDTEKKRKEKKVQNLKTIQAKRSVSMSALKLNFNYGNENSR